MSKTKSSRSKKSDVVPPRPVDENIFASPWKKSDVILKVEGISFHVHRSILTMQSPVFDAMLDGHFKEANQEKITLKGKTPGDMLQFLKLLYPESMIKKPLISFSKPAVYSVLRLADEYQTEDVMSYVLSDIKVRTDNVFSILPYANKYNELVRKECVEVVAKSVPMGRLEQEIGELDSSLVQELLIAKCKYLESRKTTSAGKPATTFYDTSETSDSDSSDSDLEY